MTDTRKDKRAPISLKVRFKSATVDEFIEQYAKDISKGGIFIKSNKNSPPMPIGTLLKFEFQLKDESKLIQGVGRVVWKRELEGSSDNDPAGMGIKFIKMDNESKSLVDQIVAGRNDAPGQFEAGGGSLAKDEPEAAPAAAASTAPSTTTSSSEGKRPVRSAKATMQFFPSTTPQNELPKPEDRTQVRHASEFLASALSSAGVDEATTGEAEKKAEEARKRSEEIEREREEQQRRAREEEDKKARAEKERQEREKAEAEEKAAAAAAAKDKEKEKAKPAAEPAAAAEPAKKKTSDRPPADKAAKEEKKPAAAAAAAAVAPAKKPEPKAAVAVAPPAPADAGSNMMPIFAGVLVVVALGGYYLFGRNAGTPDDTQPPPPPPSTTVEAPPPTDTVPPVDDTVAPEDGTPDVIADDGTAEDGTVDDGTGDTTPEAIVEPPPPAVTHDVRVDSAPAAAILVVDGEERGAAPQTLTLAEGDHTVEARLPGYRTATQTIHSAAGARPVRMALTALPYVVHVTTTPPGARVRVGARPVTSPGDATIPRPTAPVTVTASLAGYLDGTQRLEPSAFTQGEDAMSADVSITLAPRPAAPPPPPPTTGVRRPPPTTAATDHPPATTTTPPATEAHTAPPPATEAHTAPPPATEAHTAPPPATEAHTAPPPPPPASEAPPDNPF